MFVSAPLLHSQAAPGDSVRQAELDSLAARLARAEADIALLHDQLATEAGSQVHLRSRLRLELHARILTNAFFSTAPSSNIEVPMFAQPEDVAPSTGSEYGSGGGRGAGLSVRQTTLGAAVSVDSVLGGTFDADVEMDLFAVDANGAFPSFPQPRLRTARAFLRLSRSELMIGSDTPLISDLDPVSTAALGIPEFSTAGNLWNWLPQVRVTRELGSIGYGDQMLHWAIQGALLTPFAANHHVPETDGADAGIRSGRPFVEARLRARWGDEHEASSSQQLSDKGGEIGIGVHHGWLRASGDSLTTSHAISADLRVGLGHGLEVRGEAYRGRVLRGLGGGGIEQNFGPSSNVNVIGDPLTSNAGWMQLNDQLLPTLIAGVGCGTEHVENDYAERNRNTICSGHVAWRPAVPLLIGFEYRNITTSGADGRYRLGHFNLAFGIEL